MKKLLLLLLFFPLIGFTQQGTMNAWYTTYGYTSVELKNLINSNSSITFYDEKTYPNHDIIAVMNIIQANVSFKITFSLENKVVNKIKYEFNCRNGYQDYVDYLDGETSILKSLFFECYKQELIWGCNDGSIHTTESKHTPNGFFNFEGTYPNCSPNLELGKMLAVCPSSPNPRSTRSKTISEFNFLL